MVVHTLKTTNSIRCHKIIFQYLCNLLVLNTQAFYLSKICELLLDQKRWAEIKERGAYEYPGFETKENNVITARILRKQ